KSSKPPVPSPRRLSHWDGSGCRLCPARARCYVARESRSAPSPDRCPSSSAATLPECVWACATPGEVRDRVLGLRPPYQIEFARCGRDSVLRAARSAAPSVGHPPDGLGLEVLRPWPSASVLSIALDFCSSLRLR